MAIGMRITYPKEDRRWPNLNGEGNGPAKAVARRSMTSRKKTSRAQNAALPLSPNPRPSQKARRPESPSRITMVGVSSPGRLSYFLQGKALTVAGSTNIFISLLNIE